MMESDGVIFRAKAISLRRAPFAHPIRCSEEEIRISEWGLLRSAIPLGIASAAGVAFGMMVIAQISTPARVFGPAELVGTFLVAVLFAARAAWLARHSRRCVIRQGAATVAWSVKSFGRTIGVEDYPLEDLTIWCHPVLLRHEPLTGSAGPPWRGYAVLLRRGTGGPSMAIACVRTEAQLEDYLHSIPIALKRTPVQSGRTINASRDRVGDIESLYDI
jgi:hypothetical protein